MWIYTVEQEAKQPTVQSRRKKGDGPKEKTVLEKQIPCNVDVVALTKEGVKELITEYHYKLLTNPPSSGLKYILESQPEDEADEDIPEIHPPPTTRAGTKSVPPCKNCY